MATTMSRGFSRLPKLQAPGPPCIFIPVDRPRLAALPEGWEVTKVEGKGKIPGVGWDHLTRSCAGHGFFLGCCSATLPSPAYYTYPDTTLVTFP